MFRMEEDENGDDGMEIQSSPTTPSSPSSPSTNMTSMTIHDDEEEGKESFRKGEEEEDAFHKTYQFKTSRKTFSSSFPTEHLFYSSTPSLSSSHFSAPSSLTSPSSFSYFSSPHHRNRNHGKEGQNLVHFDTSFENFENFENDIHHKTPFITWKSILYETVRMQLIRQKFIPKKILQLISRHPYTPLSILDDFPFLKWEYDSFYDHPLMNETFLYEYQAKHRRRVFFLSVPPGFLGKLPSSPFNKEEKENNRLDWVDLEKSGLEDKKKISHFPSLPLSLVLLNPHKAWDYPFLLLYREWTISQLDVLLNSYRIPWKLFSRNHFLTLDILYEFIDKPWDWKQLALHPRFPPQLILQHSWLTTKWNWKHAYKHPRMNIYAWNHLRNTLHHQPFHSSFLLANSFQYCSELRLHAFLLLQKNIRFYYQRKVLENKRKFLTKIIRGLPLDMTHYILSYYIL